MKVSDPAIVVEQHFDTSVEALWAAITELSKMRQWFFNNIPNFRPVVGFETNFEVYSESRVFTHQWKVTEVAPLRKITYNWNYAEYPGDANVTFEIKNDSGKVVLILNMEILEDFPQQIPEFQRESCIAGWNYFIGENLKQYFQSK